MEKFHDKMEENFVIDTGNKEFQDALSLIQYTSQSVYISVSFFDGESGYGQIYFFEICVRAYQKEICSSGPDRSVGD